MPYYGKYCNDGLKQASPLTGYGRSAIHWDLKCDDASTKDKNNDRLSIYNMLMIGGTDNQMAYTSAIVTFSITLICFSVCVCCTGAAALFAQHEKVFVCSICYLIGVATCIIMTVMLVVDAPKAVQEKYAQADKMEKYDAVNGCSDPEYVHLPKGLSQVVEDSVRYIQPIPMLSWIVLVLTILNLFAECGAKWYLHGNLNNFMRS